MGFLCTRVIVNGNNAQQLSDQFRQIFTGLEVNKMRAHMVSRLNAKLVEDAIRILKPKKMSCWVNYEEHIVLTKPDLWSSLVRSRNYLLVINCRKNSQSKMVMYLICSTTWFLIAKKLH